jgi:hypothetical protein
LLIVAAKVVAVSVGKGRFTADAGVTAGVHPEGSHGAVHSGMNDARTGRVVSAGTEAARNWRPTSLANGAVAI